MPPVAEGATVVHGGNEERFNAGFRAFFFVFLLWDRIFKIIFFENTRAGPW